jgi:hypothetical protein
MPRLSPAAEPTTKVEFVVSPSLDLMNAMYFTHLAGDSEGIDDWPAKVRQEMAPELLAELDFLYTFPKGQPGIMGQFGDHLWAHRETWTSIDAIVEYLRSLPEGIGEPTTNPGIQGLVCYVVCGPLTPAELEVADPGPDAREALIAQLKILDVDVDETLAIYDDPERLRDRMVNLIERFYEAGRYWSERWTSTRSMTPPILQRSQGSYRGGATPA